MIKNTNDGTNKAPYLRTDINSGNYNFLPDFSTGPKGSEEEIHQAVKAAGFMGIQGGNPTLCKKYNLGYTGGGRVNNLGEIENIAKKNQDQGAECITLHVGWGMESDQFIDALVGEILNTAEKMAYPIYIETHRATITQDIWRTVELVKRFPEIRFNGDFSHWYTGLEMVYGGFERKLEYIQPVLDRTRFLHARIGNPGCMQVDIGDGKDKPYVEHFKAFWTKSFEGFLKSAKPGDYICFNPELLQSGNYYARVFKNAQGQLVEESDRWEQAKVYTQIAKECFKKAQENLNISK
jgi:sugar phosphate isomerase/epimerase